MNKRNLIENNEIEFNAILKNNIIKFSNKEDVIIGDYLFISDGVNENTYMVTSLKKDMTFELVICSNLENKLNEKVFATTFMREGGHRAKGFENINK